LGLKVETPLVFRSPKTKAVFEDSQTSPTLRSDSNSNDTDRRKPKYTECHFVCHISHMDWLGTAPKPPTDGAIGMPKSNLRGDVN